MLSALSSSGWAIRQRIPASRLRDFIRCRVWRRAIPLSETNRKYLDKEDRSDTDQHDPCPVYPASPWIQGVFSPPKHGELAGARQGDQHVEDRGIEARDP